MIKGTQQQLDALRHARIFLQDLDTGNVGGTDAADDCVLAFLNAATVVNGPSPFIVTNAVNAATGSVIGVTRRGLYGCELNLDLAAHADTTILGAIIKNATAAQRNADPTVGIADEPTVFAFGHKIFPAAAAVAGSLFLSCVIPISQAEASVAGGALIRFIATNDNNTHPSTNAIPAASTDRCYARVTYLGDSLG
ncbi:MAG: hypothetical protein K0U78_16360 [Actinomycetia bacterium]|nr:hypothetical protein [Actinomycetes bacterium]